MFLFYIFSYYVASNDRMIGQKRIKMDLEGSGVA